MQVWGGKNFHLLFAAFGLFLRLLGGNNCSKQEVHFKKTSFLYPHTGNAAD
jgi:hypothetical protein